MSTLLEALRTGSPLPVGAVTTDHTPGPWCVRDLGTAKRYIGPSQDGGEPSVAFVLARVNVPEARLDADARLVAAAPELLAALQHVASGEGGYLPKVRAAIAKATGAQA